MPREGRTHQGRAVEVDAQALSRCAQALDRPAQQFGAVPGSDDQRDKLKRQGHHRAAEPGRGALRSGVRLPSGCSTNAARGGGGGP